MAPKQPLSGGLDKSGRNAKLTATAAATRRRLLHAMLMGLLVGQGWVVASEVMKSGNSKFFSLISASLVLGLALACLLLLKLATPQGRESMQRTLFWMSCTLTGGLAAVAQLRIRGRAEDGGKTKHTNTALLVNWVISSGLLGASLPHIFEKVVRKPDVQVILPTILAFLVTEVCCVSGALPMVSVSMSFFLCAAGLHGVVTQLDGSAFGGAGHEGKKQVPVATVVPLEPFFPTTIVSAKRYSPCFLIRHRLPEPQPGEQPAQLVQLAQRQAPEVRPVAKSKPPRTTGKNPDDEASGPVEPVEEEPARSEVEPKVEASRQPPPPDAWSQAAAKLKQQPAAVVTVAATPAVPLLDDPWAPAAAKLKSKKDEESPPVSKVTTKTKEEGKITKAKPSKEEAVSTKTTRKEAKDKEEPTPAEPTPTEPAQTDTSSALSAKFRKKPEAAAEAATTQVDATADIRWNVIAEEMQRIDEATPGQEAKASELRAPLRLQRIPGRDASPDQHGSRRLLAAAVAAAMPASEAPRQAQAEEPQVAAVEQEVQQLELQQPLPPARNKFLAADEPQPAQAWPLVEVDDSWAPAQGSRARMNPTASHFVPEGYSSGNVDQDFGEAPWHKSLASGKGSLATATKMHATAQAFTPAGYGDLGMKTAMDPTAAGHMYSEADYGYYSAESWPLHAQAHPHAESWDEWGPFAGEAQSYGSYVDQAHMPGDMSAEGFHQMGFWSGGHYDSAHAGNGSSGKFGPAGFGSEGNHAPVASLMDDEIADPGLGRASQVRRVNFNGEDGGGGGGKGGKRDGKDRERLTRMLWVGNLQPWVKEAHLQEIFGGKEEIRHIKLVYLKQKVSFALLELPGPEAVLRMVKELGENYVAADGCTYHLKPANRDMAVDLQASSNQASSTNGDAVSAQLDRRAPLPLAPGPVSSNGSGKGSKSERSSEDKWAEKGSSAALWIPVNSTTATENGDGKDKDDTKESKDLKETKPDSGVRWAYIDPRNNVQTGFSNADMRQWFELGYFTGSLQLAKMTSDKEPPPEEFYPLRQWFPQSSKSFTFVPSF